MFGIGGWEFVLIAVLALLLFGPDKLPQFARTLGRFMRDIKKYQDLMESTVRGEILAADPDVQKKDPFKTGKEFRERVAGGSFTKASTAPPEDAGAETADPGEVETAAEPVTAAELADEGEGERDEA